MINHLKHKGMHACCLKYLITYNICDNLLKKYKISQEKGRRWPVNKLERLINERKQEALLHLIVFLAKKMKRIYSDIS